jgi:hypothetical protein
MRASTGSILPTCSPAGAESSGNRSFGEEDQPAVIDERIVGALKITSEY